jgi:hypothetical protein
MAGIVGAAFSTMLTAMRAGGRLSARTARIVGLTATLTAAGAACGDGAPYSGTISCTQTESVENFGPLEVCEEAAASARSQLQPACTGGGATIMNAPCSRVGTLGGCEITSGGFAESFWDYPSASDAGGGATPTDIQMLCALVGGTALTP